MKSMKFVAGVSFVSVLALTACGGDDPEPFYESYESPSSSQEAVASGDGDTDEDAPDEEPVDADTGHESSAPNEDDTVPTEDESDQGFVDELKDGVEDVDSDEILDDIFGGGDDDTETESPAETNTEGGQATVEYDRSEFPHWNDIDGSGCDARNETLARDLTTFDSDGCIVSEGVLEDPMTGEIIYFEQGGDYENSIDIDHIVPLEYAATHGGAMGWTDDEREQFANDPDNMLAVSPSQNRSKGSAGPGEWMPDNESFHCDYVTMFASVAKDYDIQITEADAAKIQEVC